MNRAAAYTLYQAGAQITLRSKTEHANAQESLWHRNKERATIFLTLPSFLPDSHTHFHRFPLLNFLPHPPPPPASPPSLFFKAQPSLLFFFFTATLIVPPIPLFLFIAPFVKLEAPGDKAAANGRNVASRQHPTAVGTGRADKENVSFPLLPPPSPAHSEVMGRPALDGGLYASRRQHVSSIPAATL